MKRWLLFLVTAALFAGLAGCGGDDPKNKDKEKDKDKPLPAEKAAN
jgi:hypothetical protein